MTNYSDAQRDAAMAQRKPLKGTQLDKMKGNFSAAREALLAAQGGVATNPPTIPQSDDLSSAEWTTYYKGIDATSAPEVAKQLKNEQLIAQGKFMALRKDESLDEESQKKQASVSQYIWKYLSHEINLRRVAAAAAEARRIKEEKRKAKANSNLPFANLSTEDGVALCWDGEKRLMSPSDWEKGGGDRLGAVWREVHRREKELLRENKEARGSAGREVVPVARYAPATEAFHPFRSRSLLGDAHLASFWRPGAPECAVQIALVDEAWPIVEQENFGMIIIETCWSPQTGAWMREQGISTTLARILTMAMIATDQCLCVAAEIAEETRDVTGCPLDDLVRIYDNDTFVRKDGAGKLCLPGTVMQRILELDQARFKEMQAQGKALNWIDVKPYASQLAMVAVQRAITSGRLRFDDGKTSFAQCAQGKQLIATTIWRAGLGVTYAASIGLQPDRLPLTGTVAEFAAVGITVPRDVVFEEGDIPALIHGVTADFMKERRKLWEFAQAEYAKGSEPAVEYRFEGPFATGGGITCVVRDGVATCDILGVNGSAFQIDQVIQSDLYKGAEEAFQCVFDGKSLREYTSPASLLCIFSTDLYDDDDNYTIWCGQDFVIVYKKDGRVIVIDKRTFLRARVDALMQSRATGGVGAAAAPSVVMTGGHAALAVPRTLRAPGVLPAGQSQLDAEASTSSITAGVKEMEVSPLPKAAPDVEEALRADDPDASTELPLANTATAAATGVASDERAPGGAPAAARPVVPTTWGGWIPRGEAPPDTVEPYLSPQPLDVSPIAPPTHNPTVARSLLKLLDDASDLQVTRGDALDGLLDDAAAFDVDDDKAMAYEEKKDEEPPDTGRTADVPSRSSLKDRAAPTPPRRDRRAAKALSDGAGRVMKGQFEPSPAKGTSAHN